jgi:AraC-like DNA-binding protein
MADKNQSQDQDQEPTLPAEMARRTRERIDRDREAVTNVWIERILSSVRKGLFRPGFNVDELRAELGLRDNTVPEQFRNALGISPRRYIEDRRLETSCRLLLETDVLVDTIGRMVGYDLPRTFNRAFCRRIGCSPTEWRESRGAAGHWPGSVQQDDDAPPPLNLPPVLVGVGTLDDGHVCDACGRSIRCGSGVLAFENLRPLCEVCTLTRGPRELKPFYRAALAEVHRCFDADDLDDDLDDLDDKADEKDANPPLVTEAVARWLTAGDEELERALTLWDEIEELSAPAQEERVRELDPPFVTEALFYRLREESQALIRDHPGRSRQLAELALIAVETIAPTVLGGSRRSYLESEAWAWLANARRVACDLRGADEALSNAYTPATARPAKPPCGWHRCSTTKAPFVVIRIASTRPSTASTERFKSIAVSMTNRC